MASYQWKPLTDEKIFEDLVNDLCSAQYGIKFQIYGRKGQKQYGIDGSALTKDNKHILHQCKNKMISRNDSAIQLELLKDLETETDAMIKEFIEQKGYALDKFIFANSFKRDTKLQNKATELSLEYEISIVIWSWDEISDMLEKYTDIAQKFYPNFFREKIQKKEIQELSNEKSFLDKIHLSIQNKKPLMLLSITSSPLHYTIENYYKKKIIAQAKEQLEEAIFFDIELPNSKNMSEQKYFKHLAKQCNYKGDIEDGYDFKVFIEDSLKQKKIFLLISEFENGSDVHREIFAEQLRSLYQKFRGQLYIVLFGREKLASLKYSLGVLSPLNMFEEHLLPTPTVDDYVHIMETDKDIKEIYNITGGHPELVDYCIENIGVEYRELLLRSNKFFDKYYNHKEELLELFEKEKFGYFMIWSNRDDLYRELFWGNLIVQEGSQFRWIAPIVAEMGMRYFR